VLAIVFLLSVFLVVQFYLSREVSGKDKALDELNARIAQLNELLSLEKVAQSTSPNSCPRPAPASTTAGAERDRAKGLYEGLAGAGNDAAGRASELGKALDSEKQVSARALAQVEVQNQQDRRAAAAACRARSRRSTPPRKRDKDAPDPHHRSSASASTWRWRSGAGTVALPLRVLRAAARDPRRPARHPRRRRPFSCSSPRCSSIPARRRCCAEGKAELDKLADALKDLDKKFPGEIAWVLRSDGHTDVRPINSPQFKIELGVVGGARHFGGAVSGVAGRAAAAAGRRGFGEFQPLDTGTTEDAYRRNRRIELKLTER